MYEVWGYNVFQLAEVLPFVMSKQKYTWEAAPSDLFILKSTFTDFSPFDHHPTFGNWARQYGRTCVLFCHHRDHRGDQFGVLSCLVLIYSGKIIRISVLWRVEWKCKQCFPAGRCFITLTDAFEFAWVADRLGYLCVSRTWKTRLRLRLQLRDEVPWSGGTEVGAGWSVWCPCHFLKLWPIRCRLGLHKNVMDPSNALSMPYFKWNSFYLIEIYNLERNFNYT